MAILSLFDIPDSLEWVAARCETVQTLPCDGPNDQAVARRWRQDVSGLASWGRGAHGTARAGAGWLPAGRGASGGLLRGWPGAIGRYLLDYRLLFDGLKESIAFPQSSRF